MKRKSENGKYFIPDLKTIFLEIFLVLKFERQENNFKDLEKSIKWTMLSDFTPTAKKFVSKDFSNLVETPRNRDLLLTVFLPSPDDFLLSNPTGNRINDIWPTLVNSYKRIFTCKY